MNNSESTLRVAELAELLVDKGWTLACAESCTGGLLAAAMTSVPGSSAWFDQGFVTYSNSAKVQNLGVNTDTLERFGAVSEETAIEMAAGTLQAAPHAHVAVSTTGIAGPDGASPGKPVGMVCFGFSQRAGEGVVTRAMTKVFEGDRSQVRQAAVAFALHMTAEQLS